MFIDTETKKTNLDVDIEGKVVNNLDIINLRTDKIVGHGDQ